MDIKNFIPLSVKRKRIMQFRVFLIIIFFTVIAAQAQQIKLDDPRYFSLKKYFTYTAQTDTAINITYNSAIIVGSNTRTKSNKADTLATKKPVQNWMVWWNGDGITNVNEDFSSDVNWNVAMSDVAIIGGGLVFTSGVSSKTASYTGGNVYAGTLYYSFDVAGVGDLGDNISFLSDGINLPLTSDGTYSGIFVNATEPPLYAVPQFTASATTGCTIDNFILRSVNIDSSQGTSVTLTGLTDSTTYTYYHSIVIKSNDGDLDYYKGTEKTFLTLTLPDALYVVNKSGGKILFKGNTYAIKFKD